MQIDMTSTGDTVTIAVAGEIDLATADKLRRALTAAVDADAGSVVVDLARVTYIDSVGLGVLVGAGKRLAAADRQLSIRSAQPRVLKLFALTGLVDLLQVSGQGTEETNGTSTSGAGLP